jgi:HSP20 family protein
MNTIACCKPRSVNPSNSLLEHFFSDPFFAIAPLRALEKVEPPGFALDVSETAKEFIVRADMPGFRKDDVRVEVRDGVLTISAEVNEEKTQEGTGDEKFLRRERRYSSLTRSMVLPTPVHEEKATAQLKDGVLTLTLPKHEKALPRNISVN